jgi:LPXTG-motif cell wall-anchored protein
VIRRILVLGALVATTMATLAVSATTASAQYVPGTPGIVVNPGSTTVGGEVTVEGSGCPADVTVTIKIGDVVVGTVTSNSDGDFILKNIKLPPSITPGQYTVHALCGDLDLTAVLSVSALPPSTTTTVASTGTLPVTGTDSGMWVKVGLSLLAVGGLLVLATRRRRSLV